MMAGALDLSLGALRSRTIQSWNVSEGVMAMALNLRARVTRVEWIGTLAIAIVAALALTPSRALAGQAAPKTATFTKDIAPILQRSCQTCHRPDSVAPMSLMTYEDVRPWARSIKQRTGLRNRMGVMPPWFIDKHVGIQDYKDDISLSEQRDRDDRRMGRRWCAARQSGRHAAAADVRRRQGMGDRPTRLDHRHPAGHDEGQRAGLVGRAAAGANGLDRRSLRLRRRDERGQHGPGRNRREVRLPPCHPRHARRNGTTGRVDRQPARSRTQRRILRATGGTSHEGRFAARVSVRAHARQRGRHDGAPARRVQVPPEGIQAGATA